MESVSITVCLNCEALMPRLFRAVTISQRLMLVPKLRHRGCVKLTFQVAWYWVDWNGKVVKVEVSSAVPTKTSSDAARSTR